MSYMIAMLDNLLLIKLPFEGSSDGVDEIAIISSRKAESIVVVSWGADYGSGMTFYNADRKQVSALIDFAANNSCDATVQWVKQNCKEIENTGQ